MKTKTIMMAAAAILFAAGLTSCEKIKGKGDVVTVERSVSNYSSIGLSMPATVHYSQSPDYTLEIQGQQNIIDRVETRVNGDELVIRLEDHVRIRDYEPIHIFITAPDVNSLHISGSGNIYSEGTWTGTVLSIHISGSGDITLSDIRAEDLNADISGSGSMRALAGNVSREDLTISGSGNIEMQPVVAAEVFTKTSGSGDTYVHAADLLEVTISGSGNVYYLGNPVINTHISGSGNIRRL